MKKLFFFFFFIFQAQHLAFANDTLIGETLTQIEDGLYVAQGKAVSGEDVYFAMERIDDNNKTGWLNYFHHADCCAKKLRNFSGKPTQEKFYQAYDDKIKSYTGFSEEEYKAFIANSIDKKLHETKDALQGTWCRANAGFDAFTDIDGSCYVVYMSKKPVTSKFAFPKHLDESTRNAISIKDFCEAYGDILISVGLRNKADEPHYQNRGIFRNPSIFLDGGYKGLSLKLHIFTAHVMNKFFGKTYLLVNAAQNMADILEKHLDEDDFYSTATMPDEFKKYICPSNGPLDVVFFIKTAALIAK